MKGKGKKVEEDMGLINAAECGKKMCIKAGWCMCDN